MWTVPWTACFDIDRSGRFDPGRPDPAHHMFGFGEHACLGETMGRIVMTQMAIPLLARDGLRRKPGSEGKMQSGPAGKIPAGYYTQRFVVQFDD